MLPRRQSETFPRFLSVHLQGQVLFVFNNDRISHRHSLACTFSVTPSSVANWSQPVRSKPARLSRNGATAQHPALTPDSQRLALCAVPGRSYASAMEPTVRRGGAKTQLRARPRTPAV